MKSSLLFFTLCWLAGDQSQHIRYEMSCQYYYSKPLKKNVYTTVEIEPEFPGGAADYVRFFNKNLRISEDTVDDVTSLPIPTMKFIVDTDGQIRQLQRHFSCCLRPQMICKELRH